MMDGKIKNLIVSRNWEGTSDDCRHKMGLLLHSTNPAHLSSTMRAVVALSEY